MIYKIILGSYDTSSFTGAQYNATYYTNFNEFMLNPIHLNKAYKILHDYLLKCKISNIWWNLFLSFSFNFKYLLFQSTWMLTL